MGDLIPSPLPPDLVRTRWPLNTQYLGLQSLHGLHPSSVSQGRAPSCSLDTLLIDSLAIVDVCQLQAGPREADQYA